MTVHTDRDSAARVMPQKQALQQMLLPILHRTSVPENLKRDCTFTPANTTPRWKLGHNLHRESEVCLCTSKAHLLASATERVHARCAHEKKPSGFKNHLSCNLAVSNIHVREFKQTEAVPRWSVGLFPSHGGGCPFSSWTGSVTLARPIARISERTGTRRLGFHELTDGTQKTHAIFLLRLQPNTVSSGHTRSSIERNYGKKKQTQRSRKVSPPASCDDIGVSHHVVAHTDLKPQPDVQELVP